MYSQDLGREPSSRARIFAIESPVSPIQVVEEPLEALESLAASLADDEAMIPLIEKIIITQ